MPLIYQSKIIEYDLLENINVFYVYPENVDKEGGSDFTKMMRNNSDKCLPLTLKQKAFKTKDSFWTDVNFDFARKHFITDQDKIKVLLNRHQEIIVMSLDQMYGELDDINKYSPLFAKFYKEQMDFMKDRWKPRVV